MNLAIDQLRKHRRVRPVELDEQRLEEGSVDEGLLPKLLGGNPGRALMDKEIRHRIDQALGELSENHRSVLIMRELEGLSYEEMAEAMGCSKGTIMSRLFHARKNMQRRLVDLVDVKPVANDDAGDAADHLDTAAAMGGLGWTRPRPPVGRPT